MELVRVPISAGVQVSVRSWPGDDTPFVLVHGLASNARLWDEVAEQLVAAGHPVWAVDLPGHGATPLLPDGIDTAVAAGVLAEVMAGLGLSSAIVAGQSWGGNVVTRLAADRPDLVIALVLVDGGWIDLALEFPDWATGEAALTPPAVTGLRAEDLLHWLHRAHPDWSAAAIEASAANLRELPDGTLERPLPIPAHMRIVRDMWDHPPRTWLAQVSAPALLLPALPKEPSAIERKMQRIATAVSLLPRTVVREYPGADHDLHAQHPKEIAADILEFCR